MSSLELKEGDLFLLLKSLQRSKFSLDETIKIYSTDDIDEHFLGDPREPTYREEIEKVKNEIHGIDNLCEKITKAIYDLRQLN